MANPADKIKPISQTEEFTQDHDIGDFLRFLTEQVTVDALITAQQGVLDESTNLRVGTYTVDLYGNGVPLSGQANPAPTRIDVPAFVIDRDDASFEAFEVGAPVKVKFVEQGYAIIVPQGLPRGTGIGKILTLLDARRPSVAVWDHPRFW